MKIKVAKVIGALDRVVDYFIPSNISADRDARNRAHVFLVSHILGPFIGNVVPIALYFLDRKAQREVIVPTVSSSGFGVAALWTF